ncbi:leucine-rich repeat extensin-like protein 5 [Beta vulgaris subsp. vulgaris]|uniref:leucine-rich repeat extensin-like protein 5 n=1 Tax=Beta vulgaris subsp. vulgaris TaxID=3555 RepID=UPI002036F39B|nr:leucine-rich repeat extensin-like protein 5 [Beta vulgaris subsp. vulgaris]
MAKLNFHFLLTLSLITLNSFVSIAADEACPYPCNPPPIAGTITPPTPVSETGSYPPPTYSLPPPSGNFPNYPPGAGGTYDGDITMPPPPDPILPYFPYYYRNGVHQPSDQSSSSLASASLPTSTVHIFSLSTLLVAVLLLFIFE